MFLSKTSLDLIMKQKYKFKRTKFNLKVQTLSILNNCRKKNKSTKRLNSTKKIYKKKSSLTKVFLIQEIVHFIF